KKEIKNIVAATNWIAERILNGESCDLTPEDIKAYNKMVQRDLPLNPENVPGEYRHHDVWVGHYKGAPPADLALLVEELCDWLNRWPMPDHLKGALCILKAIIVHVYIAWIHPFADGNGRTARLIEF